MGEQPQRIFLSYRRDDLLAATVVGRLHDHLTERYGAENVFMDVDTIPPGVPFDDYLAEAVSRSNVLIALIGRDWVDLLKSKEEAEDDFVRIEIESALARGIPVVPLLVGDAPLPVAAELPPPLAPLSRYNAFRLDPGRDFKAHVSRLTKDLDRLTGRAGRPQRAGKRRGVLALMVVILLAIAGVAAFWIGRQEWGASDGVADGGVGEGAGTEPNPVAEAQAGAETETPKETSPSSVPIAGTDASQHVEKTKTAPFVNSLGMTFMPVPISGGPTKGKQVSFSVWETRVQDYAAFAAANPEVNGEWKGVEEEGHAQESDHPVIMVSLKDANAFCAWLTAKEREEGRIGARDVYRLPTDHEWSCAVGIGDREDSNAPAESKDGALEDYPWQAAWPPPEGSGNYAGKTHAESFGFGMEDYDDGFAFTSPVGSFAANFLGIHDLGGNVWEWCSGTWDGTDSKDHLLRGASWRDVDVKNVRSSARRVYGSSGFRFSRFGFRCVLERGGVVATKESPFVNTLEMKFVPVPIAGKPGEGSRVLFSMWETRVQDFRRFVEGDSSYRYRDGEDPYILTASGWEQSADHGWDQPGFTQTETTGVTCVSWEDAGAFCRWLTEAERGKGRIGARDIYRLPTDHEWSCAVGTGDLERAESSPKEKDSKIENLYPWGTAFPPPAGAGNFAGSEVQASPWPGGYATIEGFNDGYPRTAPVGSFEPNELGLFDLSGNLWEWCADWFDPKSQKGRVLRGGSWLKGSEMYFRSSFRYQFEAGNRYGGFGFRCVLEVAGGE